MRHWNVLYVVLLTIVTSTAFSATGTWEGSVSSDITDPNNWSPALDVTDSENDNLTFAAGSNYAPILNYTFPVRPWSFNVSSGANLTVTGGDNYPYGNNTFNGETTILNGYINSRGTVYIGYGAEGTLTVDGGTFASKYAMYIGRGSGGNGTLNVLQGIVWFSYLPNAATNGGSAQIYVEEGGYMYYTGGDEVDSFQDMVDNGYITTAADSVVVVDYQDVMDRTRITAEKIKGATLPVPWDKTEDTAIAALSWDAGPTATSHEVYYGTDSSSLSYYTSTAGTSVSAPTLTTDTTYYWRVDTITDSGTITGDVWSFTPVSAIKPRKMEKLDRGVMAIESGSSIYVGWRMFGTDPSDLSFHVYRNGTKITAAPITDSTNYLDSSGSTTDFYAVAAVIGGIEQPVSKSTGVETDTYYSIDVQQVPGDTDWSYEINDGAVGDLDGDGDYELIVKRYSSDYDEHPVVEAYTMEGAFLWRINLGPNHLAVVEIDPIVYDLDSDGYAEVVLRTCEGMTDGVGNYTGDTDGDGVTDYRVYGFLDGYIDIGPEFLTVFDGRTGAELARTDYIERASLNQWGDNYGHRSNKFHIVIAYLDGYKPSIVMCRGIYALTKLEGWNYRDGELYQLWHFTSEEWTGFDSQGNHNLTVGDVDEDGKDEIVYGGMCVDHDGTGLYTTGNGHGDAIHMSDMDPGRDGQEVWRCIENDSSGITLVDAEDGSLIFEYSNTADVGRCCAGDIDPRYAGYELWGSTNCPLYSCDGTDIGTAPSSMNFMIYWDADLLREMLDHAGSTGSWYGAIYKWNYTYQYMTTLLSATGTLSDNWTKGNPVISGDLFGDWREEVIWRADDNQSVRIYTTTDVTTHRIYTLMHDPQYRLAIAWQCCGYNQPPHPGFFIGDGMDDPPTPDIELVDSGKGGLVREYWLDVSGVYVSSLTGDSDYPDNPAGMEYITDFEGPANWSNKYGARIRGYIRPGQTGDYTFWITSDDQSELWLSTDATAENASLIAYMNAWMDYPEIRQWDKWSYQQSDPITLTAGHKYYVEAIHKESTGNDHLAVAWQLDGTDNPQVIDGIYLRPWDFRQMGDNTSDDIVNMEDVSDFSGTWDVDDCDTELSIDMDGDCSVDMDDLAILASNWLAGVE